MADDDEAFRVHLKRFLPLSNAQLDAEVHALGAEVSARTDCTACTRCCQERYIVVDDKDIRRIARRLKVSADAFAREHVALADDGVLQFAQKPCPLLGSDGKCTVYEDRPQACRDFPYLHLPHVRSRSITLREAVDECPIVGEVWGEMKRRYPPEKRR